MPDQFSEHPFVNGKRARSSDSSLQDVVAKKRQKTEEEKRAVTATVAIQTLQKLKAQIAREWNFLKELFSKFRDRCHDHHFHHVILEKEDLTISDLKEMEMMTDLPEELKEMLRHYIETQEQIEQLNKQIEDTQKQLQNYQVQQQQLEDKIEKNEQEQQELLDDTVDEIHEKLSEFIPGENLPEKEGLKETLTADVTEEELEEMPIEILEDVSSRIRKHTPELIPTFQPANKSSKGEVEEEQEEVVAQEQRVKDLSRALKHFGPVVLFAKMLHEFERNAENLVEYQARKSTLIQDVCICRIQFVNLKLQHENANEQLTQVFGYQHALQQRLQMYNRQARKLEDEISSLESKLGSHTPKFKPLGYK